MREIVERYGIKIKNDGQCSCPFHGKDKKPSMKIYKDSYHCFACGANGDIFTFVQKMDNCDFKTAFYSLGGEYERKTEKQRRLAKMKLEAERRKREQKKKAEKQFINELSISMELARFSIKRDKPYSDRWVLCQNFFPYICHIWEETQINKKEVSVPYVTGVCRRFRQEFDSKSGLIN